MHLGLSRAPVPALRWTARGAHPQLLVRTGCCWLLISSTPLKVHLRVSCSHLESRVTVHQSPDKRVPVHHTRFLVSPWSQTGIEGWERERGTSSRGLPILAPFPSAAPPLRQACSVGMDASLYATLAGRMRESRILLECHLCWGGISIACLDTVPILAESAACSKAVDAQGRNGAAQPSDCDCAACNDSTNVQPFSRRRSLIPHIVCAR